MSGEELESRPRRYTRVTFATFWGFCFFPPPEAPWRAPISHTRNSCPLKNTSMWTVGGMPHSPGCRDSSAPYSCHEAPQERENLVFSQMAALSLIPLTNCETEDICSVDSEMSILPQKRGAVISRTFFLLKDLGPLLVDRLLQKFTWLWK